MDEKGNHSRIKHLHLDESEKARESRLIVKSLKARQDAKRSYSERVADLITGAFGSISFLIVNIFWFAIWMVVNLGAIPHLRPFDPFPFGLLTMVVSLEAIILAVFVLISQNREGRVSDLREEIDIQIDLITEEELTKMMGILVKIAEKNKIDLSGDLQLQKMLKPFPTEKIERALEKQVAA